MSLLPAVTKCSGPWWARRICNLHVGTAAVRCASKTTTKSTSGLAGALPSLTMRRPAAPAFQSLTKLLGIPQEPGQEPVKRLYLASSPLEIPGRYFHLGPRVLGCGVGTRGLRAFSSSVTPPGCTCGEQNATSGHRITKCPVHDSGRGILKSSHGFGLLLFCNLGSIVTPIRLVFRCCFVFVIGHLGDQCLCGVASAACVWW